MGRTDLKDIWTTLSVQYPFEKYLDFVLLPNCYINLMDIITESGEGPCTCKSVSSSVIV
jgi:hypothetical protein